MIFQATFRDPRKEQPRTNGMVVSVYFMVKGVLYKGQYHCNGCYYAYKTCGGFDAFASATGNFDKGLGHGDGKNDVCEGWCYVDELINASESLDKGNLIEKYRKQMDHCIERKQVAIKEQDSVLMFAMNHTIRWCSELIEILTER